MQLGSNNSTNFLWQDMFDFDNMGFTNTVEHIKFLSCGDCEVMFNVMENLSSVPFNELQRSGWTSWLPQSANQKKLFGPSKVVLVYLLRRELCSGSININHIQDILH